MKTFLLTSILLAGLTVLSYGKPINNVYSVVEPEMADEAYISDIPFNTWEIAVDAILSGDEATLPEENYINDIPFNTREIACRYWLKHMLETTGEININDIPFSTERIYCEYFVALLTEKYRNEQNTSDLPAKNQDYTIINPSGEDDLPVIIKQAGMMEEVYVSPGFSL